MTKREWKRRYMESRQLRKWLKRIRAHTYYWQPVSDNRERMINIRDSVTVTFDTVVIDITLS